MVLSEQLQHMHRGGEWSRLAKLSIFVPPCRARRALRFPHASAGLGSALSRADVGLFARKQTNPHKKRRGGTQRVNARLWQRSKFAVNWEAQTIVIPTLLSGFPRGLIQCQSLLRILRQSLFQAEFSSWSHHTASWQPPIALPLYLCFLLFIFTCSQSHNSYKNK